MAKGSKNRTKKFVESNITIPENEPLTPEKKEDAMPPLLDRNAPVIPMSPKDDMPKKPIEEVPEPLPTGNNPYG